MDNYILKTTREGYVRTIKWNNIKTVTIGLFFIVIPAIIFIPFILMNMLNKERRETLKSAFNLIKESTTKAYGKSKVICIGHFYPSTKDIIVDLSSNKTQEKILSTINHEDLHKAIASLDLRLKIDYDEEFIIGKMLQEIDLKEVEGILN